MLRDYSFFGEHKVFSQGVLFNFCQVLRVLLAAKLLSHSQPALIISGSLDALKGSIAA
jgi:hypothetical protein